MTQWNSLPLALNSYSHDQEISYCHGNWSIITVTKNACHNSQISTQLSVFPYCLTLAIWNSSHTCFHIKIHKKHVWTPRTWMGKNGEEQTLPLAQKKRWYYPWTRKLKRQEYEISLHVTSAYLTASTNWSTFRNNSWSASCCRHDEHHVVNLIGRYKILLLTHEILQQINMFLNHLAFSLI